jgi:predicted DsbA family dithiol-disulfide isomerase
MLQRPARGCKRGNVRLVPVQLEIDFVSDVACPWCAIGLASLEEALRRTADAVAAAIHFQPFELNPGMRPGGENIDELIGGRYGADARRMAEMRETVRARAAAVGFTINQDSASRIYNTFDAHRLLHWAEGFGRQQALKHALFKANFTDGADVSDPGILVAAAVSAGLDPQQAREVLTAGRYTDEVRQAEQLWLSRGINSVPGIVINGKWLISGGQPPEVFEQALREIAARPA